MSAWLEDDMKAYEAAQSSTLPQKYASLPTTSARIRAMVADGYKPMAVAKLLNKRPQHVYNVLRQPLKKS